MVDWGKVQAEYISQGTSYRKLAEKYGVSAVSVAKHGKAGNWVALREENQVKAQKSLLEAMEGDKLRRALRVQEVADQILEEIGKTMENSERIGSAELKNLAGTLKTIKDIQMIRSALDEKEQQAKVAAMEKQLKKQDEDQGIEVRMDEATARWAD